MGGQPVFILGEDTERTQGSDAQHQNIQAAKAVGDTVKSTLGPKGMDKMLVNSLGDIVVTNDGATILDEMDIEHPAAKMVVEVAETQDEEVGDGTSTAVILAGQLLEKAENLLEQDVHPSVIANGFRKISNVIEETLEELTTEIDVNDKELLKNVAKTAMTGKSAEDSHELLTQLSVDAIQEITDKGKVDLDDINVESKQGGSVGDSSLVEGMILDKEKANNEMPSKVSDAKIAVLDTAIEVEETQTDAEIQIDNPEQMQEFLEREEETLKEMVNKIKQSGANVVISSEDIDDMAIHQMVNNDVFAIENLSSSDLEKVTKATGASTISNIDEAEENDLGEASSVGEKTISGDKMVFIEGCKNPKALTILVRGSTKHIIEEAKRTLKDALSVLSTAIRDGKVLPGGGATEIELALTLRQYATSVEGREQLAIEEFANALETLPRILAENAGHNPIDTVIDLKSKHKSGNKHAGIDAVSGKMKNMTESGVVEPISVKKQALSSATEASGMILRIDDVISGGSGGEAPGGAGGPGGAPGGMPGGMGGMM
ncbi:thermosome subunit [archaeon SCG-AAA382B04]|nr:thermosome subunit [archaeon SCG-AAA382B04]